MQGLLKLKVVHKQDNLSFVDRSHSLFGEHEPISKPSTSGGEGDSASNLSITSCYRSVTAAAQHLVPHLHSLHRCFRLLQVGLERL